MVGRWMRLLAGFPLVGLAATALWLALDPAHRAKAAQPAAPVTTYDTQGSFQVNGERFFPIGLSMPPPLEGRTPQGAAAIDEIVDGGVTVFRTGANGTDWTDEVLSQTQAWGKAAAARGALMWVWIRELAFAQPGTPAEARLRQVVETLRDNPGLGLWKGADEPWPRLDPQELAHAFATVKALDPNHLFHTIFGPFSIDGTIVRNPPNPPDLSPYNAVTDTHGINVYPVYHPETLVKRSRLHRVGEWMAALKRATGRTAVTMTLQICFSGSSSPYSADYVLPTRRQERFMIYDAILNGATGLFFYGGDQQRCYNERDRALGWNWTFWDGVLEGLLDEIKEGSPLYAALLRPETTVRLRTSNPNTAAISRRGKSGELWVIATHRGNRVERATIRGLPTWARFGRLYPSGAKVRAANRRLTQRFPGWEVRVVRFTRPS